MTISPARRPRGPAHARFVRRVAPVAVIVVLGSVLTVGPAATAQDGGGSTVPLPAGGISDWERVVDDADAPPPAPSVDPVDSSSVPIPGDPTRLQVKFTEASGLRWADRGLDLAPGSDLARLLSATPGLTVEPLFGRAPAELDAARDAGEARTGEALPDLTTWFLMTVGNVDTGTGLRAGLDQLDVVEMVQPEPTLASTQDTEEIRQGYLDPGPVGVDAEWSWGQAAGTGANATIAVIDSGFDTAHPDLGRAGLPGVPIPHEAAWDSHHGTQVLGILVADNDLSGIRGIAYGSPVRTINSGRNASNVANAIELAAAALGPGDVVTISQGICAQTGCGNGVVLPLVYSASARDALRLAAAAGVITVVSAGNGGANLNSYGSRLGTDAPDSIVVGAGNSPATADCTMEDGPTRGRVSLSNYGSRVDLQGWGSCVRTTSFVDGDPTYIWWGFTSAATPIVAGAAALLSSQAQSRLGFELTGSQIRALFQATGSAQNFSGTRGGTIGPLPDVRDAIGALSLLPTNDMWSEARTVSSIPFEASVNARFAGVEVGEPAVTCGTISNTAWYRYTPSSDVTVTIDTWGSEFDTMLGLWRQSGSSLERVACSDDVTVNNPTSAITRKLNGGDTYFIQVGGNDGADGTAQLSIEVGGVTGPGCDIDDDGYGDLVSGSPTEDIGDLADAGRALVHFGRSNGRPTRVTSITQEWPSLSGSSERGDAFGAAVACGDFDGDGYDDIAIGGPLEGVSGVANTGAVRVIEGRSNGLATSGVLTFTQDTPGVAGKLERGDWFGTALAAGDFDGDGYTDLAVGAKGEDIGSIADAGLVHVFYGSASGLRMTGSDSFDGDSSGLPNSAEDGDKFGATLAAADVDGDGFDELIVGSPSEDLGGDANAGAVFVLPGGAGGTTTSGSVILHQDVAGVAGSAEAGDRFGQALATGDINGDGFAEIVVGVPGEGLGGDRKAGLVHVFVGGPGGASGESQNLHQDMGPIRGSAEAGDGFGSAVTVGDFTGDGFADLAVGVPGEDIGDLVDGGILQVFDGSADLIDGEGDQVIHQNSPHIGGKAEAADRFASALANVDLDGDDRRDVVVGAPDENIDRKADVGYVLLLPGVGSGVSRAQSSSLSQASPATGANEAGDRFGAVLGGG